MAHKSPVSYRIAPTNPNAHVFTIHIDIPAHNSEQLHLALPSWLPGSYMIRDFAKNIITFKASFDDGSAVSFYKTDKQNWVIQNNGRAVFIEYQVYAFDLSVRTAYLDNQRGFFNGSSTLLEVKELAQHSCSLHISPPEGITGWRVATGLTRAKQTDIYKFGEYLAKDYQHLIDCPVELGNFDVLEFTVEDVPHYLVFAGKHFADKARLTKDVAKLCKHHIQLFGEAPFKEYWFITNLLGNGFGGLEHKNSTILVASRFDLPNPNKPRETSDNYKTFLSLCSHEYFHAWNVCRIKPEEFVPYDLSKEVHTTQLWAYEGITSYYDDFSLYRAGIISFEDYLNLLAKTMTRVHRGDGELKQSVKDSSFDTWTKFYKQGPDAVNNIVSYYTKGSLVALWLDLTIRLHSNQQHSLDDVMRLLWQQHGKTGIGTNEQDFVNALNQFAMQDLAKDFKNHLNSMARMDLSELLSQVGVKLDKRAYDAINSIAVSKSIDKKPYLGAFYQEQPQGLKITAIEQDSPAEKAGLSIDDVIVAIDMMKMNDKSLKQLLAHTQLNSTLTCHYFRDDLFIETEIQVVDSPKKAINLAIEDKLKNSIWLTIK